MNAAEYEEKFPEMSETASGKLATVLSEHGVVTRGCAPTVLHHAIELQNAAFLRLDAALKLETEFGPLAAGFARADLAIASGYIHLAKEALK